MKTQIEQITTYRVDGNEFKDLSKVKDYIENEIGMKIINKFSNNVKHSDMLKILEVLTEPSNRKLLTHLLNIEVVTEENFNEDITINILDI